MTKHTLATLGRAACIATLALAAPTYAASADSAQDAGTTAAEDPRNGTTYCWPLCIRQR